MTINRNSILQTKRNMFSAQALLASAKYLNSDAKKLEKSLDHRAGSFLIRFAIKLYINKLKKTADRHYNRAQVLMKKETLKHVSEMNRGCDVQSISNSFVQS